jgi:hypothetical protein
LLNVIFFYFTKDVCVYDWGVAYIISPIYQSLILSTQQILCPPCHICWGSLDQLSTIHCILCRMRRRRLRWPCLCKCDLASNSMYDPFSTYIFSTYQLERLNASTFATDLLCALELPPPCRNFHHWSLIVPILHISVQCVFSKKLCENKRAAEKKNILTYMYTNLFVS